MEGPVCPVPLHHQDQIVIGHGSGGRMTQDLIRKVFMPRLSSLPLEVGNDSARITLPDGAELQGHLSVSTDAHIVTPLFFPGGDIGRLAVCGTVNDVSMSGAQPLYLTAGFILEEGLPVHVLERVLILCRRRQLRLAFKSWQEIPKWLRKAKRMVSLLPPLELVGYLPGVILAVSWPVLEMWCSFQARLAIMASLYWGTR
jgi:hypothetical protein